MGTNLSIVGTAVGVVAQVVSGSPLFAALGVQYVWVHALIPVALLIGFLRLRLSRSSVGEIAIELTSEPGRHRLQDVLARRLGDPTLVVAYWSPMANAYLDDRGRAVEVSKNEGGRSIVVLEHAHQPLAAIVHDASLEEDPTLLQSVSAVAHLVAENERLESEVRFSNEQMRAARAKAIAAAELRRSAGPASRVPDSAEAERAGALIRGRYEALEVVGYGGQGQVVRALDYQHHREVALKIRSVVSEAEREGLLQEARVLLNLRPHPGLPLVREDFFEGDRYYMVIDWIAGISLAELLENRGSPGLPLPMVVEHLAQVADALDHLHEHAPPIVHQDVKPGNLILNAEGRVVLVDFGLSTLGGESTTTRAGTSGYVAPEIAAGEPGAPASDLYGLAATAFTLLTGTAPRGVLPSWGGLPPAVAIRVERAIRRSLSIDPNRRHPRASEFVTELAAARAALDGPRRRSLPRFVRGRSSN